MAYHFQNKSAREITGIFNAIVDNQGTPADIDAAFEALKAAPSAVRRRVVDDLEDDMIRLASFGGAVWAIYNIDDQFDFGDEMPVDQAQIDKQLVMLRNFDSLKPVARALVQIAGIKGDMAQLDTKLFVDEFDALSALDQRSGEKIAESFSYIVERGQEGMTTAQTTLAQIEHLVRELDVEEAIDRLKAADSYTRERLVDKLETIYTESIIANAPKERARTADDVSSIDPLLVEKYVGEMQSHLSLCAYIAGAKGEAASPVMKAYVEAASSLAAADRRDFLALGKLSVQAVDMVAAAEQAAVDHVKADSNQKKLNGLAARQKIRIMP